MAKALEIKIKTTERFIIVDSEWIKIDVDVSAAGRDVKNATVSFAIEDGGIGTFENDSATTNKYGVCSTRFKASEVGYYTLKVTATKSPYTTSSFTFQIMSYQSKVDYTDDGVFYYSFLEQKKIDILNTLSKVLDNDNDFYLSTGASDPITYRVEWNFQLKDFPLIVCTSGSPSLDEVSFNHIIDNTTRGGRVNVDFGLNLVAENKTLLDRMVEKVIFILSVYKKYELYAKYGIQVLNNGISTGSVATEEYAAKFLYGQKITIASRIEMAYNFEGNAGTIDDITITGTIDSPIET